MFSIFIFSLAQSNVFLINSNKYFSLIGEGNPIQIQYFLQGKFNFICIQCIEAKFELQHTYVTLA